jgi:hypothetical protein
LIGFAPPITNPLPDGFMILKRGFSDNFFIRCSRVIALLAVCSVLLLGAGEFPVAVDFNSWVVALGSFLCPPVLSQRMRLGVPAE